jgi:hypothetical protein
MGYNAAMKSYEMSPSEIARSQDQTAQEFLKHGARLVADPGADKLRVELTDAQTAIAGKDGHKEGGQLEDAQLINKMVSINQERDTEKASYQQILEEAAAYPSAYFGFLVDKFGNLDNFRQQVQDWADVHTADIRAGQKGAKNKKDLAA